MSLEDAMDKGGPHEDGVAGLLGDPGGGGHGGDEKGAGGEGQGRKDSGRKTSTNRKTSEQEKKRKEAEEKKNDKKKKAFSAFSKVKQARPEEYADDSHLYEPRINRDLRTEYYTQLIQNNKVPYPQPPKDYNGWISQNSATQRALEMYAPKLKQTLRFITSPNWDYVYIYGFMLWALATGVIVDGFVPPSLGLTYQSSVLMLPIVAMILSLIVPTLGSILLIRNCNDLTRTLAQVDFISWSVVSVVLMQYIERYYYGGVYKSDKAGKVAGMTGDISTRQIIQALVFGMKYTPPKIHPEFDLRPVDDKDQLSAIEEGKEEESEKDGDNNEEEDGEADDEKDNFEVDSDLKSVEKSLVSLESGSKVTDSASQARSESGSGSDESDQEEIGYLAQIRKKREKQQAEAKERELEERLEREAAVTDWVEWNCVCCGRHNRRPAQMPLMFEIKFGSKGVYYKRHYAKLKQKSTRPECLNCYTSCDYVPPLGSAHLFDKNPKKTVAFTEYPKKTTLHPALKTDKTTVYLNDTRRFFFGIDDDITSLLLPNDWRLPKYLATIFPAPPRYVKPPEEFFEVGEFLECKYQKVDWSRCIVKNVHSNHTYDIKYVDNATVLFFWIVMMCVTFVLQVQYR
jgi:hypothetical protein